jgi:release factor glutamine methyltransferase
MTYDELMAACHLPRAEARALMAQVLSKSATWIVAHGDQEATRVQARDAQALFARRRAGEPQAYLLKEKEFYGRRFVVSPEVLIPRPETELMVDWSLELLAGTARPAKRPLRLLDMGCGSGCIGLSVALECLQREVGAIHLTLTDISPAALAVARGNARGLGVNALVPALRFAEGSWFSALQAGETFDLILSNPPYIKNQDVHLSRGDLRFEPPEALASDATGLGDLERIVEAAMGYLEPSGLLMLEHGFDQKQEVQNLLSRAGFSAIATREDLAGHPRTTLGRRA